MNNPTKYFSAAHYAAILRNRATIERTVRGDGGYNGLAANFDAAADMLDIQAGKIVAKDVLLKHFKENGRDIFDAGFAAVILRLVGINENEPEDYGGEWWPERIKEPE